MNSSVLKVLGCCISDVIIKFFKCYFYVSHVLTRLYVILLANGVLQCASKIVLYVVMKCLFYKLLL